MNESLGPLVSMLVPILGRALLHFVWQGAVIGIVAAVLLHTLRGARPQARYAVASLAMLACALAPLLDIAWQLANARAAAASLVDAPARVLPAFVPTLMPALGNATQTLTQAWRLDDALPVIVALWASGACTLSLRMALGVWWIQRLCRAPQHAAASAWHARLDALAQRFDLRRPVALRLVDSIASPASVGWWRPVVLLPTALLGRMPVELVEALLAHELAHIRRHDYLVNLLQGAVEALLFYHPVTWWLSRRIRIEREQVADQLAADVIAAPRRLALALSELSELSGCLASCQPLPSLALAAHGGHLMSRIEHLVRPALRRSGSGRIAFPLLGATVACVAFLAHAQVGTAATQAPASASAVPASSVATPRTAPRAPAPPPMASRALTAPPAPPAAPSPPPMAPHALPAPPAPPAVPSLHTLPAPPALPAVPPAPRIAQVDNGRHAMREDPRHGTSYAIVRKGEKGLVMSGSTRDVDSIKAMRRDIDSDFLWVRRANKEWVIVDPATLARAERAWAAMEPLDKQMETLDARMEVHNRKMDALNAQMDRLEALQEVHPEMDAAAKRLETLGRQQEALADKEQTLALEQLHADAARQRQLSSEMKALSAQQQALSREMDQQSRVVDASSARIQANAQPMEAIGKRMEEAGKPMEALGTQMSAVGKQIEQVSKQAERDTMQLIDEAMAKGLAKPAPTRD